MHIEYIMNILWIYIINPVSEYILYSKIGLMNISFAKFGAIQLIWRLQNGTVR